MLQCRAITLLHFLVIGAAFPGFTLHAGAYSVERSQLALITAQRNQIIAAVCRIRVSRGRECCRRLNWENAGVVQASGDLWIGTLCGCGLFSLCRFLSS